ERGVLYRSAPVVRRLGQEKLSQEEALRLAREVLPQAVGEGRPDDWEVQAAVAVLAAQAYPEAKRELVARGRPAAEVEALPVVQVVLMRQLDEYEEAWDELLKWMSVPYAQGHEPLERLQPESAPGGPRGSNLLLRNTFATVFRVHQTNVRLERQVAALRCVEAVRGHAAAHGGAPPRTLADVKDFPPPTDPVTGKGF